MNIHTQVCINMINLYDNKYANLPMSERDPIVLKFLKNNPSRVRYRVNLYDTIDHIIALQFATTFTIILDDKLT